MQGVDFTYKNTSGVPIQITHNVPQYLFLEPNGFAVIRYYFTKNGIDTNTTKIYNEVVETDILLVKIRKPDSVALSRYIDFENIQERQDSAISFEISFDEGDTTYVDVLYKSKIDDRLKIKISSPLLTEESFENENTVTDGPDEYVKVVDVQIRYENVYYVYIHRRSGRLRKSTNTVSWERLASILKDRLFKPQHPDHNLPKGSILKVLNDEGWLVDYGTSSIYKEDNGRKLEITSEELGILIRDNAIVVDILNLLKTNNFQLSNHPLIKESEKTLVSCDKICALPDAVPNSVTDNR